MTARLHDAEQGASPNRGRASTVAALGLVACTATATVLLGGAPAGAASTPNHGSVSSVWQNTATRQIHLSGYAYSAHYGAHSKRSVHVKVYVDGRYVHTSAAKRKSSRFDRRHHLTGKHAFRSVFRAPAAAHTVSLVAGGRTLTSRRITHYRDTGAHVVAVARAHVGAKYRYGAAGPRSFDCSGYAKYVYAHAGVATLPHNSESQRHAKRMRTVSKRSARPGDLVFYLSGGDAYHVSIYAGHGKQYSATNPSRGVEYSKISSRHVVYGTDWH